MILFFLRIFLVLLSLTGYLLLLHRKGIEAAFGPVLTVSGIGLTMYAAGLLNIMPLAAGVILLTGYAFFLGNLRKTAAFSSPKFLTVLLFFASLCVFLAFRLYGTEFSWVDNFTHWAVVVKDMLKTDHLPNFASSLVTFQSYPTGTAGVIYCFCKLIGETDHAMIWSQGVILASCLCVFWAFVKKPSFFSTAIILLASYYLLGMNISVSELCVDTLVSLLAIASFAVIFYYRSDRLKAAIFSCAIISYLVLVKNSALLFMLLHGILLLILEYSSHLVCDKNTSSTGCPPPRGRYWRILFFSFAIPLCLFGLWDRHVALCFASASTAPHSLTTDYIQGILSYKGFWGLFEIVRVFVRRLLAPEEELFLVATVSAAYLIMGLLKSAGKKRPCRLEGSLFAWSWFVYLCYLAGMLAMYLFSMPLEDALELGSFNRYLCTATAYLVGICIIYLLNELDTVSVGGYLPCLLAAVSLSFLIVTSPVRMTTVFYDVLDHTTTEKHQLKEIKSAYAIPDGASCCIITSSEDAWLKRKAAYELWSDQIVILSDAAKPLPQEVLHNYDYLILLDASPNMEAFLSINHIPSGQRVYALSELR